MIVTRKQQLTGPDDPWPINQQPDKPALHTYLAIVGPKTPARIRRKRETRVCYKAPKQPSSLSFTFSPGRLVFRGSKTTVIPVGGQTVLA